MAVKDAVIILMGQNDIMLINGQPQTFQIQRLAEQANRVMKNKLSKKIKAKENPN